jgi:hypothetical protein
MDAIHALDRLNSWVRSPCYSPSWSGPRDAIYRMKRVAIRRASESGIATHRGITVPVKCRRCNDQGRYIDWDGRDRGACWTCNGTHQVMLDFVETRITDGPTWHSPWQHFPLPTPCRRELVLDWKPNSMGIDMKPSDVAACLCSTEMVFAEPHVSFRCDYDGMEYRDDPFNYCLYIGIVNADRCGLCGRPENDGASYVARRGRICWHDHACIACEALARSTSVSIYEQFKTPADLITGAITDWIVRHPQTRPLHKSVVVD